MSQGKKGWEIQFCRKDRERLKGAVKQRVRHLQRSCSFGYLCSELAMEMNEKMSSAS